MSTTSKVQLWGEIAEAPLNYAVPDIDSLLEMSMLSNCMDMFDTRQQSSDLPDEIIIPGMDPHMLYAIDLHQHANQMTEMIRIADLAVESDLLPPQDMPVPPLPFPLTPQTQTVPENPLRFKGRRHSFFSLGKGPPVPHLSEEARRQLLAQCCATMFAHIGFDYSSQNVIEVLIDVLESFLTKFCQRLKFAHEAVIKHESGGFPDIVERVLTETGLGGISGLHEYLQIKIVKYEELLRNRSETLVKQYEKILSPRNQAVPRERKTKKKIEIRVQATDEMEVPEMHFPSMDGDGAFLQPSLESGYQMLNSLEQANLQRFEPPEDNPVPNIKLEPISQPSPPYSKRKRYD